MTNSHLLGLITFGSFAFFALLAWVVSNTHPDVTKNPSTQRRTRWTALFLFLLGAVFGYFAFTVDYRMRITTLHEVMMEGNVDEKPGMPIRTVSFVVEHPGVVHKLFLSPTSKLFLPPSSDAEVSFSLLGPQKEVILPEQTARFTAHSATDRDRADWDGRTFSFTPTIAGTYTLQFRLLTPGIPHIQVRIEDPSKRDGTRPKGY